MSWAALVLWAITFVPQEQGPFCAAAAATMAAEAAGTKIDFRALLRSVEVHRDGISYLDLGDALAESGLETLVFRSDRNEAVRATQAGQALILSLVDGPGKHAVLATRCDTTGCEVLDPGNPGARFMAWDTLTARWAKGQSVAIRRRVAPDEASAPALVRWRAETRTFRAWEWALRAEKNGTLDVHTLTLYDRAVAEDPRIAEIQNNRALVLVALGRVDEARAALGLAIVLKPEWPMPRENLRLLNDRAASPASAPAETKPGPRPPRPEPGGPGLRPERPSPP